MIRASNSMSNEDGRRLIGQAYALSNQTRFPAKAFLPKEPKKSRPRNALPLEYQESCLNFIGEVQAKPRMTQQDRWKQRNCTKRYWAL